MKLSKYLYENFSPRHSWVKLDLFMGHSWTLNCYSTKEPSMKDQNMTALIFPGQGTQKVDMGLKWFENYSFYKQLLQESDEILQFSISKLMLQGTMEQLTPTQICQPAIFIHSYAAFKIMEHNLNHLPLIKYCVGHSLGEYNALVACGYLSFQDALKLVVCNMNFIFLYPLMKSSPCVTNYIFIIFIYSLKNRNNEVNLCLNPILLISRILSV